MHSWIPPQRFFPYLTWTEIAAIPNREQAVIIQPLGSIEQHGAHLPLVVDIAISTAVIGKTLAQLPPEVIAYSLPPLPYGKATEHLDFPGTISLSTATLSALLSDVAESIYRSGFRKLVLWNSHGGQPQILELIARDLHQKYPDFMIFPFFTWRVPSMKQLCVELFTPQENSHGIHAGDAETSLMLAILPDGVQMSKALREYPHHLAQTDYLSIEGDLPFAWVTSDLTKSGVIGDPTTASVEKGEKILTTLIKDWTAIIAEIYYFSHIFPKNNRPSPPG